MEISGSIDGGTIDLDIDVDDVRQELNLDDYIADGCRDAVNDIDFSEYISIEGDIDELLSQYDGMNNPCGLGKSFEKAVWWAMSRHTLFNEDVVRKIVREELRAILNMGVSRLDVQAKYKRVDDDTSDT